MRRPHLLTCPDSCVVVDVKNGENARLTGEYRRKKFRHKVYYLDPFRLVTREPDTLNPVEFVDKNSQFAIEDSLEIGAALVDRKEEKGDGVHFLDTAEAVIAAAVATAVRYAPGAAKSLQGVCDMVGAGRWPKSLALMRQSDAWGGLLARMGDSLTHLQDRELASTMSTAARFLRFLSTPAVAESTRSSSFDPAELRGGKVTVYLVLPADRALTLGPLLRLWVGCLMRAVVRGGLQEKNKVHFICDEAGLLGKMDQIASALTVGRGFGLLLQLYYQDLGQLRKCWPDGADQTVLANSTQIYFRVNDLETARRVSEHLGKGTIVVDEGGASKSWTRNFTDDGKGGWSQSGGTSTSWKLLGREVLTASEVMALDRRGAVVFTPGVLPFWAVLLRYYENDLLPRGGRLKAVVKSAVVLAAAVGAVWWMSLLVQKVTGRPLVDVRWVK